MQAAVGYLRVSTREQGRKGVGLAAQRHEIERFALQEGLEVRSWHQDRGWCRCVAVAYWARAGSKGRQVGPVPESQPISAVESVHDSSTGAHVRSRGQPALGPRGRLLSHALTSARSHPTAAFPSRIRRGKSPAFSSRSIVGLESFVIALMSANRPISLINFTPPANRAGNEWSSAVFYIRAPGVEWSGRALVEYARARGYTGEVPRLYYVSSVPHGAPLCIG